MPFYHVLISSASEPTKLRAILTDLSEDRLAKQFLRPYRKGQNIICGNEVISIDDVRKVHVVRTERDNEAERATLNERSHTEIRELNSQSDSFFILSPGRGYDPEDILEIGEDVTGQVLSGPPGHGALPNPFLSLFGNQWVVAVGTGIIVAAIIWLLGWT